MTGLLLVAESVAMYRTCLTLARPPQTVRCPRILPLSRLIGATPTRLAICLRFKVPSSGSSANRVTDRTWPTPGTLLSRSSRIRQRGLWRMVSPRPSSSLVSSFSSQAMCRRMPLRTGLVAVPSRFFSAVSIVTTCRRRANWASNACAWASGRGRARGRIARPK